MTETVNDNQPNVQGGALSFKAESTVKKDQDGRFVPVEYEMGIRFGPEGNREFPVLKVLPAIFTHTEWADFTLKQNATASPGKTTRKSNRAAKNAMKKAQAGLKSIKEVEAEREKCRVSFPKFIIVGWVEGTLLDGNGNAVPYSQEACQTFVDYLVQIDPDEFDDLCWFCRDRDNFGVEDDGEPTQEQLAELGNA